jgi:hypothetical protein
MPLAAPAVLIVVVRTGNADEFKLKALSKFTTDHPQLKSVAGLAIRCTSDEDFECGICSSLELPFLMILQSASQPRSNISGSFEPQLLRPCARWSVLPPGVDQSS